MGLDSGMARERTTPTARQRLPLIAIALVVALAWSAFAWVALAIGQPSWSRHVPLVAFFVPAPIALLARFLRGGWNPPTVDTERRNRFETEILRSWRLVMWGAVAAYAGYLGVNFISSVCVSKSQLLWFGGLPGVLMMSLAPLGPRLLALRDIARAIRARGVAATLVERNDDGFVAVLASGERRTLARSPHHDAILDALALPASVTLVGGEPPPQGPGPYRDASAPWSDVRVEPSAVRSRRAIDAVASTLELLFLWVPVAGWLAASLRELSPSLR